MTAVICSMTRSGGYPSKFTHVVIGRGPSVPFHMGLSVGLLIVDFP